MSNLNLKLAMPSGISEHDVNDILLPSPSTRPNTMGRISNIHLYFMTKYELKMKLNYPGDWGNLVSMSCDRSLEPIRFGLAVYLYRKLAITFNGSYVCFD